MLCYMYVLDVWLLVRVTTPLLLLGTVEPVSAARSNKLAFYVCA